MRADFAKGLLKMGFGPEDVKSFFYKRMEAFVAPTIKHVPLIHIASPLNAGVESNAITQTRTTHARTGDSDGDSDSYKPILPTLSFSHPAAFRQHQELLESLNAIPAHDTNSIRWFDQYALAELVRFDKCDQSNFHPEQIKEFRRNDYKRRSDINAAPSSHEEYVFGESHPTIGCLIDLRKKVVGKARRGKRGRNV